jgi:hypothetical protein
MKPPVDAPAPIQSALQTSEGTTLPHRRYHPYGLPRHRRTLEISQPSPVQRLSDVSMEALMPPLAWQVVTSGRFNMTTLRYYHRLTNKS